jgi:acetyl/propionyl-CoA carboxylase alpha subunit
MIKRLLVANRGEIAVRIMATASVLGIETVAVYAADDAACGHVGRADASTARLWSRRSQAAAGAACAR